MPNFGCKKRNTFDASENPWQPLCGKLFPQIKVINLWLASFFEAELDSKSHPKVLNRKTCSYWCTPRPSSAARWQLRWSWSLQPPSRNQRIGSWLLSSTGLLLQEHALFVQLHSISPSYWRTLQDSTQRWMPCAKGVKGPNTGPGWQKEGAEQLVNKADLRIGMGRHSSHLTWQQVWSVHSFQIRQWTHFLIFFPFTSGVFDDICSPLLCLKGTSGVSL